MPEEVALAYGRAVYANDADAIWRLVSAADRRVKDEATFRRQQRDLHGFAREAVHQLAGFTAATPVTTTINGDRASTVLRFRLPDANSPLLKELLHDWDEDRLNALADGERARIRARLAELHRQATLPLVEGDEAIELVREGGRWKIFLNWAGGVRVGFEVAMDPEVPLQVTLTPEAAI
ncbi:MAG: hypothetical protein ACREJV_10775, partial [Candidatus Rokuibacteriota bacterium]